MTAKDAQPGNVTYRYMPITEAHGRVLRLSGVLEALAYLTNENARPEARAALVFLADELAADLLAFVDAPPAMTPVAA